MAAKRGVTRGAALVDRVIERVREGRGGEIEVITPRPIAPDVLATLELGGSHRTSAFTPDPHVQSLTMLTTFGCAGSDVYEPWSSTAKVTGGVVQGKPTARYVVEYENVAPAVFALWLRAMTREEHGFNVTRLHLVSDAEPTVDTARARTWLDDPGAEPLAAYRDPGFPVVEKGKGPARLAFVSTKAPIEATFVQQLVGGLYVALASLPKTSPTPNVIFILSPSRLTEVGFEIKLSWFAGQGVFPHDPAAARALTINALSKLHHATGAIAGVEWALGVAGDDGTALPAAKRKR